MSLDDCLEYEDEEFKPIYKVPCEVYSRVVGYFRPINNWNPGKQQEFHDRVNYSADKALA